MVLDGFIVCFGRQGIKSWSPAYPLSFLFPSYLFFSREAFGFILRKVENTAFSGLSSLYILQLESSLICPFLHNLYLATFPQSLIYWPVVTSELLSPIRLFEQLE